ncbi:hypothetical protein E4T52_09166 [Aureobasidium sp. EXF-3400]|nr:hypothetical protein E4T52_09166 [Aureobasidium sp. EXF-3400]
MSCVVVLLDDYKLTPNGLLFGIPAVLLLGVVYAIHQEQTNDSEPYRSVEDHEVMVSIMILPLISATACYLFLESDHEVAMNWRLAPILCLNLAATASTIGLAPSMLDQTKNSISHTMVLFALPGFTALLCQQLGVHVYLSYVQILAFLASICCCALDIRKAPEPGYSSEDDWLELPTGPRDDTKDLELSISDLQDRTISVQNKWPLAQAIFFAIATITWIHFLTNNFPPQRSHPNTQKLRLDTSYTPTSTIDIVMSIYREPPSHITSTFSLLTSLPSIATRSPLPNQRHKSGEAA